jgi:aubergine-like protein
MLFQYEDTKARVTIRLVGLLEPSSLQYLQLQNIILRTCMGKLNLTKVRCFSSLENPFQALPSGCCHLQVGRDFFNSADSKTLPQHKLEVWPGILTSIRQHEHNMLMCTEVSSKVIRTDSVLDKMREDRGRGAAQDVIMKNLVGKVVMT